MAFGWHVWHWQGVVHVCHHRESGACKAVKAGLQRFSKIIPNDSCLAGAIHVRSWNSALHSGEIFDPAVFRNGPFDLHSAIQLQSLIHHPQPLCFLPFAASLSEAPWKTTWRRSVLRLVRTVQGPRRPRCRSWRPWHLPTRKWNHWWIMCEWVSFPIEEFEYTSEMGRITSAIYMGYGSLPQILVRYAAYALTFLAEVTFWAQKYDFLLLHILM